MVWRVTTPATDLPIPIEAAAAHLLLDSDAPPAQLDLVEGYLAAAVQHVENVCEHAVGVQSWTESCDAWPAFVELKGGNIRSVTKVSYIDVTGAEQILPTDGYQVRIGKQAIVRPPYGQSWPTARRGEGGIEVEYVVGYTADDLPKPLRQAILLLVGDFDENKGVMLSGTVTESRTVSRLLWPYRAIRL